MSSHMNSHNPFALCNPLIVDRTPVIGGEMGELVSKIGEVFKLPHDTVNEMDSILTTIGVMVVGTFNLKNPLWYYIALVAATFGLTISVLKLLFPPMSAERKVDVDILLLVVSIFGFASWLKIKKDPEWSWKQFLAKIVTEVEFFLAVGGVVSLCINLYNDWQEWQKESSEGDTGGS